MTVEPEALLLSYLASESDSPGEGLDGLALDESPPVAKVRVLCNTCQRSRSIYCAQCLKLLTKCPPVDLKLPFDLDIILDDKRETATGVQAIVLLPDEQCRLIDYNRDSGEQSLDMYKDHIEGTYLLYPGDDSAPLDRLAPSDISRLVVLDCKWVRDRHEAFGRQFQHKHYLLILQTNRQDHRCDCTEIFSTYPEST